MAYANRNSPFKEGLGVQDEILPMQIVHSCQKNGYSGFCTKLNYG